MRGEIDEDRIPTENSAPVISDELPVDIIDGTREDRQESQQGSCFNICVLLQWRRWIKPLLVSVYLVILIVALSLNIYDLQRKDVPLHKEAWFVGGLFAMMAIPISMWGIVQHMVNYTQPHLQRHIIRILWMVPIYALNAWLALRFHKTAVFFDVLRECYEAYVIYNFMCYLLNFLRTEHTDLNLMIENKPQVKHIIPCCCLPKWPMEQVYIDRCRHGVLQYTIIRPAMTLTAVLCMMTGVYGEGEFDFTRGWVYTNIINNISQILAMYCLIMFYRATKEELAPIKPVPKFICVKAVVFLSFWQSFLLSILGIVGVLKPGTMEFTTPKAVAAGIQDFLICIEMFLAAIGHYFSFSHRPFMNEQGAQANLWRSFLSMWDISDVGEDVADHITYVSHQVRRKIRPNRRPSNREETVEKTPLLHRVNSTDYTSGHENTDNHPRVSNANRETGSTSPIHTDPLDTADDANAGQSQNSDHDQWECSLDVNKHERNIKELSTLSLNNYLEESVSDVSDSPSLIRPITGSTPSSPYNAGVMVTQNTAASGGIDKQLL